MFDHVHTVEELKKEYRKMAFRYHPDRGGDAEMMKKVNLEYEITLKRLKAQYHTEHKENANENKQGDAKNAFTDDGFRTVIEKIIHLDVEIEICGRWIWVYGNTKPHKEALKKAGFFWASKKKMWYWRPEDAKVRYSTGMTDMNYIRNIYGSDKVKDEKRKYSKGGEKRYPVAERR